MVNVRRRSSMALFIALMLANVTLCFGVMSISSLDPEIGSIAGGTNITVSGSGFSAASAPRLQFSRGSYTSVVTDCTATSDTVMYCVTDGTELSQSGKNTIYTVFTDEKPLTVSVAPDAISSFTSVTPTFLIHKEFDLNVIEPNARLTTVSKTMSFTTDEEGFVARPFTYGYFDSTGSTLLFTQNGISNDVIAQYRITFSPRALPNGFSPGRYKLSMSYDGQTWTNTKRPIVYYDSTSLTISDMSPSTFTKAGGIEVSVTGSGFDLSTRDFILIKVQGFPDIEASDINVQSTSALRFNLPAATGGVGTKTVKISLNDDSNHYVTTSFTIELIKESPSPTPTPSFTPSITASASGGASITPTVSPDPLIVSDISPALAPITGRVSLVVAGSGMAGGLTPRLRIGLGAVRVEITNCTVNNNFEVECFVADGDFGALSDSSTLSVHGMSGGLKNLEVEMTIDDGSSYASDPAVVFNAYENVVIDSYSPNACLASDGISVTAGISAGSPIAVDTIAYMFLDPDTGTVAHTVAGAASDASIPFALQFTVPSLPSSVAVGTYDLAVSFNGIHYGDSSRFHFYNATNLEVDTVAPSDGLLAGGYTVHLYGGFFFNSGAIAIQIEDVPKIADDDITRHNESHLSFVMPAASSTGVKTVQLALNDEGQYVDVGTFTFVQPSNSPTSSASSSSSATSTETSTMTATVTASSSATSSLTASMTSSETSTLTSTATSSLSETSTMSSSASETASSTSSMSSTVTPTVSMTSTASVTATMTMTSSPSSSSTSTSTVSSTMTETGTSTLSSTASSTETASLTMTETASNTASLTASSTSSLTASMSPTSSSTSTSSATNSVTSTISMTATASVSSTISMTATSSASVTETSSSSPSSTSSVSPTSMSTKSKTPSVTSSLSPTSTVSQTESRTASLTASLTATSSVSNTMTVTMSSTASMTSSESATNTLTSSISSTMSSSETASASATHSVTASSTASETATESATSSLSATSTASSSISSSISATSTISSTQTSSSTESSTSTVSSTRSVTSSVSETTSRTVSSTVSMTQTSTSSASNSATLSATHSPSASSSSSASSSVSPSSSVSETTSSSSSVSPSSTHSMTSTRSSTVSVTKTESMTVSATTSMTQSSSETSTMSSSASETSTMSSSASETSTMSSSASSTNSMSSSVSVTETSTMSVSATSSVSSTRTETASSTATASSSLSATRSVTASSSLSATSTETSSATATASSSLSSTRSMTSSPSVSATRSSTASSTESSTSSHTSSPSASFTASSSLSATRSVSASSSLSASSTETSSATATASSSLTATRSMTASSSSTETSTNTASASSSSSMSATHTETASITASKSSTASLTASKSSTASMTASPSASRSPTSSSSFTASHTATRSTSATASATRTASKSPTPSLTPSQTPVWIRAQIVAPKQISACAGLTLDGSLSLGGGRTALRYAWDLEESSGAANVTAALRTYLRGLGNSRERVVVPSSLLWPSSTATFRLTVTRSNGQSDTVVHSVSVAPIALVSSVVNYPAPPVLLDVGRAVVIQGEVRLPWECMDEHSALGSSVRVSWSQLKGPRFAIDQSTRFSWNLYIPAHTLDTDEEYMLGFSGSLSGGSALPSSDTVTIRTAPWNAVQRQEVVDTGGVVEKRIFSDEALEIDPTEFYRLDTVSPGPNSGFEVRCFRYVSVTNTSSYVEDDVCAARIESIRVADTTSSSNAATTGSGSAAASQLRTFRVRPNTLVVGAGYRLELKVYVKARETSTTVINVSVRDPQAPGNAGEGWGSVRVRGLSRREHAVHESLVLEGRMKLLDSSLRRDDVALQWSVTPFIASDRFATPASLPMLEIYPNSLSAGVTYVFTLTMVRLADGEQLSAEVHVGARSVPDGGELEIAADLSPPIALETVVDMKCSGFENPSSGNLPLRYQFFYERVDEVHRIRGANAASSSGSSSSSSSSSISDLFDRNLELTEQSFVDHVSSILPSGLLSVGCIAVSGDSTVGTVRETIFIETPANLSTAVPLRTRLEYIRDVLDSVLLQRAALLANEPFVTRALSAIIDDLMQVRYDLFHTDPEKQALVAVLDDIVSSILDQLDVLRSHAPAMYGYTVGELRRLYALIRDPVVSGTEEAAVSNVSISVVRLASIERIAEWFLSSTTTLVERYGIARVSDKVLALVLESAEVMFAALRMHSASDNLSNASFERLRVMAANVFDAVDSITSAVSRKHICGAAAREVSLPNFMAVATGNDAVFGSSSTVDRTTVGTSSVSTSSSSEASTLSLSTSPRVEFSAGAVAAGRRTTGDGDDNDADSEYMSCVAFSLVSIEPNLRALLAGDGGRVRASGSGDGKGIRSTLLDVRMYGESEEREISGLSDPIVLSIPFSKSLTADEDEEFTRRCVWWNADDGEWDDSGCAFDEAQSSNVHTVCRCSHLTTFAVEVVSRPAEPTPAPLALIFGIVGGVVAVAVAALSVYAVRRRMRSNAVEFRKKVEVGGHEAVLHFPTYVDSELPSQSARAVYDHRGGGVNPLYDTSDVLARSHQWTGAEPPISPQRMSTSPQKASDPIGSLRSPATKAMRSPPRLKVSPPVSGRAPFEPAFHAEGKDAVRLEASMPESLRGGGESENGGSLWGGFRRLASALLLRNATPDGKVDAKKISSSPAPPKGIDVRFLNSVHAYPRPTNCSSSSGSSDSGNTAQNNSSSDEYTPHITALSHGNPFSGLPHSGTTTTLYTHKAPSSVTSSTTSSARSKSKAKAAKSAKVNVHTSNTSTTRSANTNSGSSESVRMHSVVPESPKREVPRLDLSERRSARNPFSEFDHSEPM